MSLAWLRWNKTSTDKDQRQVRFDIRSCFTDLQINFLLLISSKITYPKKETFAFFFGSRETQNSKQNHPAPSGNTVITNVKELKGFIGEQTKETQKGIFVQAHPQSQSHDGYSTQL